MDTALTGRAQQLATAAVMRACEVSSARLTHAGRHAGTKEAFDLQLGIQDIQHLGRWVMSQMRSFYAPKNPIKGAYFMAHFNGTDEPYILERDLVPPPLELQCKIFSWVEDVFNGGSEEAIKAWHKTCSMEMTDYDPKEITEDDIFFEAKNDIPAVQSGLEQSAHTDKIAFLKLLIRMRRVIIQDAVLCLQPHANGMNLSNGLIKGLPEIFTSQLFLNYSRDLLQAIEKHRENTATIGAGVPVDGPIIVDAINRSAKQCMLLNTRLSTIEATHKEELARKDLQHAQALAHLTAQHERNLAEQKRNLAEQHLMFQRVFATVQPHHHPFPQPHYTQHHPIQNQYGATSHAPHTAHTLQAAHHTQQRHLFFQHPLSPPQPQQEQPFDYEMRMDKDGLTIREAYDEYYGPVTRAHAESFSRWSENRKRQWRRRREFITLIEQKAKREGCTVDSILDATEYNRLTVNAVKELIKADSLKPMATAAREE